MTAEQNKIWFASSWPSSLPDAFWMGIQMAKAKSFLTAQAFRSMPSMQPPIPEPKIAPIDQDFLSESLMKFRKNLFHILLRNL